MSTLLENPKEDVVRKESSNVRGNIWKFCAINISYGGIFVIPVIILFFEENGLSFSEAIFLQAVFALSQTVLEIPSGYLSDSWGRKKTMILGSIIGLTGLVTYSLSNGFWGFFAGEVLLAIQVSFHSGTDEAILYDTLLELGEEEDNTRVLGQQKFLGFASSAITGVIGGLVAVIALRITVWLSIVSFSIGLVFVLLLQEPKRHRLQETHHLKAVRDIMINTIVRNIPMRKIILLHAAIASLTLTLMWFTQPYQAEVGLPLALFGVTHAIVMLSTGLMAKWIHLLQKHVDDRFILMTIGIVVVASSLLLGFVLSLWGIVLLFFGRTMWGGLTPITSSLINRMTTSEIRATVISTRSFAGSFLFCVTAIPFGYMTDVLTLNQAMLFTGIASGLLLVIIFALMAPVWKQVPK